MDKRRVDSNQDFEAVNDVCELVWENGQIMTTQGQSSRLRRDPTDHTLPSHTPKPNPAARPGKLGTLVGSVMTNIDEDDDDDDDMMIPWLNYPMDCPDFLPELSGVTVNEIPKASCDVAADAIKPRTGPSQLYSASSLPSFRSRVDNGFAPSVRTQKLDAVPLGASASVANFSHFSRPAALGSLQRMPGIEKVSNCKDKGGPRIGIVESKRLEGIKPVEDLRAEAAGKGIASTNAMNSNQVAAESTTRGLPLGEKNAEPVVASSSVCSGNSVERSSDGPTDVLKRKFRDTEDSECHSEDADEDSVGVKKIGLPRASGSKRSRAAEVHNLSERRRRDRINEKMRALQELIPNCNKVDKASMLDEAIEYLKTLQLQVQMMSMGAGLCMPQMMMSHMTHFSPMGFGMGMGMGFGMGIPDMSGATSPGYPVMQGPHFPGPPPMPGHAGLQIYGLPGQGVSMPMQRPPMLPMMGGPFMRPGLSLNTNSGQPYVNQTSSQCRTTSVAFEKPPSVQNNIQQPSEANMSNASPPGLPP